MKFAFHPEAFGELEEAVNFYRLRGTNLGERFLREVRGAVEKILATPERWKILEDDVRRCFVNVFPYAVLYTIEADNILIVAVMHGKRQPGYWHKRLKK